jgi:hypothetical protein
MGEVNWLVLGMAWKKNYMQSYAEAVSLIAAFHAGGEEIWL